MDNTIPPETSIQGDTPVDVPLSTEDMHDDGQPQQEVSQPVTSQPESQPVSPPPPVEKPSTLPKPPLSLTKLLLVGAIIITLAIIGVFAFATMKKTTAPKKLITETATVTPKPSLPLQTSLSFFVYVKKEKLFAYNLQTQKIQQLFASAAASMPILSPNGKNVAFLTLSASNAQDLQLIHTDGSGLIHIRSLQDHPDQITWSADSMHLAWNEGTNIFAYSLADNSLSTSLSGFFPVYSPIHGYLSYISPNGSTIVVAGTTQNTQYQSSHNITLFAWTASEAAIFYMSLPPTRAPAMAPNIQKIWYYSLIDNTELLATQTASLQSFILSPDDKYIFLKGSTLGLSSIMQINATHTVSQQISLLNFTGPSDFEKNKMNYVFSGEPVWLNATACIIALHVPNIDNHILYLFDISSLAVKTVTQL